MHHLDLGPTRRRPGHRRRPLRDSWPDEPDARGKRYPPADYPGLRERRWGYMEYHVSDPNLPPEVRSQLVEWMWRTWVAFPLVVGGQAVGIVEVVDYRSTTAWSQADVDACQALASLAAMSV